MNSYASAVLLIVLVMPASASFAANAVNIPTGDITIANGDIKLSTQGNGILFPGQSGGLQTIPFTGSAITAASATTAVSATSAVTAQSADVASFATNAGILSGQYYSESFTIGCTAGTSAASCPTNCNDLVGNNTCRISTLNPYPLGNWTRIAYVDATTLGTYFVEADPALVKCFPADKTASYTINLEARLQSADFIGRPVPTWPNDATNRLLGGQAIITEAIQTLGPHYPSQTPLSASMLPTNSISAGQYHMFVKATPSSTYSDLNNCYFMRTPVRVTFIPAGPQANLTPR
jgi:hypothetical protein